MAQTTGKVSVTATAQLFGPTDWKGGFVLQNRGSNECWITYGEETAVADAGLNLIENESISSKDLPDAWKQTPGQFSVVCSATETTTLYFHAS